MKPDEFTSSMNTYNSRKVTFLFPGEWNDNNCAQKLNFICKRPDGKHPAQTLAPTPPTKGGCPAGFTALGPCELSE